MAPEHVRPQAPQFAVEDGSMQTPPQEIMAPGQVLASPPSSPTGASSPVPSSPTVPSMDDPSAWPPLLDDVVASPQLSVHLSENALSPVIEAQAPKASVAAAAPANPISHLTLPRMRLFGPRGNQRAPSPGPGLQASAAGVHPRLGRLPTRVGRPRSGLARQHALP